MPINASPCFAKTNRARELLEQLKDAERELGTPAHLRSEFQSDGDWHVLRLTTVVPPLSRVACIAGDVVHNLRSALDHLACLMIEDSGGVATRNTQFPVATTATRFAEISQLQLKGAESKFVNFVEALQPFSPSAAVPNRLDFIHRLDIKDKHRGLILAAVLPQHIAYEARGPEGAIVQALANEQLSFPLIAGEEIIRFSLSPGTRLTDIELKVQLGAFLAFLESGPENRQPVVHLLYEACRHVEEHVLGAAEQIK